MIRAFSGDSSISVASESEGRLRTSERTEGKMSGRHSRQVVHLNSHLSLGGVLQDVHESPCAP